MSAVELLTQVCNQASKLSQNEINRRRVLIVKSLNVG